MCRISSPAKAAAGEGEGGKLEEIRALMSTMVQQMQELPDAIKPSVASTAFGEGPAWACQRLTPCDPTSPVRPLTWQCILLCCECLLKRVRFRDLPNGLALYRMMRPMNIIRHSSTAKCSLGA